MKGDILIVDDHPENLSVLETLLETEEYKVRATTSGVLALQAVAARAPELILLDVGMPEMDGFEVCRRLKADAATTAIPVLFLSAQIETDDKLRAFAAGGQDYITKPFVAVEVLARVRTHLQLYRMECNLQAAVRQALAGRQEAYAQVTAQNERLRGQQAALLAAEAELRHLNAGLEQRVSERTAQLANTNQELEAFIYSVSHDLRAPLRRLDSYSHALLEDCAAQLDEAGRNYARRIAAGAQQMDTLITALLELARLTRAEMYCRDVDLSGLAQRLAADFHAREPARAVAWVITPGLRVNADARLLEVLLENLLDNAWKFTAQVATAQIEVGVLADDAPAASPSRVYFVRDNGAGFDMAQVERLFGVFQRLHSDQEFPGTGIGLSTVKRIVQRHGGRVWAEGAPGHGATFYFTLAASAATAGPTADKPYAE